MHRGAAAGVLGARAAASQRLLWPPQPQPRGFPAPAAALQAMLLVEVPPPPLPVCTLLPAPASLRSALLLRAAGSTRAAARQGGR